MNAAQYGYMDCMRVLLESGADKEARDNVRDLENVASSVLP